VEEYQVLAARTDVVAPVVAPVEEDDDNDDDDDEDEKEEEEREGASESDDDEDDDENENEAEGGLDRMALSCSCHKSDNAFQVENDRLPHEEEWTA